MPLPGTKPKRSKHRLSSGRRSNPLPIVMLLSGVLSPPHLRNGGHGGGHRCEVADDRGGASVQHRLHLFTRLTAHMQEGTYAAQPSLTASI
jgi:hypothetical protein